MPRRQTSRFGQPGLFMFVLVPTNLIRFALFAPFGYYWGHAINHHHVISSHIELHNGTYPTAIAAGEKIAAKWGTFAFYWNFAVFIPALAFLPPLNLPFLAIDLLITVYLSMATGYQTSYSPQDKGRCDPDRNHGFHDMLRPVGVNESFFEAAARLNSTVSTPRNMCASFVQEWQFGVALSFFYALIALLGLVAFFGSINQAKAQSKSTLDIMKAVAQGLAHCTKHMPIGMVMLVYAIIYWIPRAFFRCLPVSWKAPVRNGRRHAVKAGLGLEQKTEMQMAELKMEFKKIISRKEKRQYAGGDGPPTPLSEFLGIYDMLMLVTEQVHYLDIISLSCVSKSVRESVLPAQDLHRRMAVFRMYTCDPTSKSSCWVCNHQICPDCAQHPLIPQTTLIHHLDNCEPYCTPCYNTHILRRRPTLTQNLKVPYCNCAPVVANPNLFQRCLSGSSYYAGRQTTLAKSTRAVCRECNLHSTVELLKKREKRTKTDLKKGRMATGERWTKCVRVDCRRELGTGPRWWICKKSFCEKECTSSVHGAWGSEKKGDGQVLIGSHAV